MIINVLEKMCPSTFIGIEDGIWITEGISTRQIKTEQDDRAYSEIGFLGGAGSLVFPSLEPEFAAVEYFLD